MKAEAALLYAGDTRGRRWPHGHVYTMSTDTKAKRFFVAD